MLESMDLAIGAILNSLKAKGELADTLIVFFNDNGGRTENPPLSGRQGRHVRKRRARALHRSLAGKGSGKSCG